MTNDHGTRMQQTANKTKVAHPKVTQRAIDASVHIAGEQRASIGRYANEISESRSQNTRGLGTDVPGAVSSVGRASASHAESREFESLTAHHFPPHRRFESVSSQGFAEYFWSRVDVKSPSECWPWKRSTNSDGYGQIYVGKKYWTASRLALTLATGEDLNGLLACHGCNNEACCNPAHLYAGTKSDNEKDKFSAGTSSHRGERNPASKLTASQVAEVVGLITQGCTNVAIAKNFGVHHSTISKIRTGHSWAFTLSQTERVTS